MLGTERCDSCWELERRIQDSPDIAARVLDREPVEVYVLAKYGHCDEGGTEALGAYVDLEAAESALKECCVGPRGGWRRDANRYCIDIWVGDRQIGGCCLDANRMLRKEMY
jgi:hypothetical protein